MNLYKITGWSIVILIMALLVIYFRIRNRKRNSRKLAVLNSFANESNCTISSWDAWVNTLVGISNPETNRLFFIRSIPGRETRQVLNLSEVDECRMVKTERKVKYEKELVNVIDKIELVFSFSQHKPAVSLEFYNADYDNLTLSGELQIAQKWTGMIQSSLRARKDQKIVQLQKVGANTEKESPKPFFTRRAG